MNSGKLYKFKIYGHEATILDGRMEVSVPDESEGAKIVVRISNSVLTKKLESLRINMPNKIIFITAKDSQHLRVRCDEANNKKIMN